MKTIKHIVESGSVIFIKNNDQCVWLFYGFNEENYTVMFLTSSFGFKEISKYKQGK